MNKQSLKSRRINMKTRISLVTMLALALTLPVTLMTSCGSQMQSATQAKVPPRPEGPCEIYAAAGCPCVAAHSTTRALYAPGRADYGSVAGRFLSSGLLPVGR